MMMMMMMMVIDDNDAQRTTGSGAPVVAALNLSPALAKAADASAGKRPAEKREGSRWMSEALEQVRLRSPAQLSAHALQFVRGRLQSCAPFVAPQFRGAMMTWCRMQARDLSELYQSMRGLRKKAYAMQLCEPPVDGRLRTEQGRAIVSRHRTQVAQVRS
jgi:hypothetical protein